MAVKIQIRRDLKASWQEANPTLLEGELAIELDTDKFKIGNGIDDWNSLKYVTQGERGKSILFAWDGTKLGIKQEGINDYQYIDLQGPMGVQGLPGESLDFKWDGTKLGLKREGETSYTYKDLEGPMGETNDLDERRLTKVIDDLLVCKNKTDANIEEIVDARHGEGSLGSNIQKIKEDSYAKDLQNEKTYSFRLQLSKDGQPQIIYKEVM